MLVDTHVHPVSDDFDRYPLAPDADRGLALYGGLHYTAEQVLAAMDQAGVDQTVLVSSNSAYGYDNRYAVDAAAASPARFVAVCRLDPATSPETLRALVQEHGASGARLGAADASAYLLCAEAQRLGVPMSLQVSRRELDEVRTLAQRFPNLRIVLDHLAHPFLEDGPPYTAAESLFALADCPNVFPKFSSMSFHEAAEGRSTPQAFFETLVHRFGATRLLWGSNFPRTRGDPSDPYGSLITLARTSLAFLPTADRDELLGGTARRLYPALAASPLGSGGRTPPAS